MDVPLAALVDFDFEEVLVGRGPNRDLRSRGKLRHAARGGQGLRGAIHVGGEPAIQDHVDQSGAVDDFDPQIPNGVVATDHVEPDRRQDAPEGVGVFLEPVLARPGDADPAHGGPEPGTVFRPIANSDHAGHQRHGQVGLGDDFQVGAPGDLGQAAVEAFHNEPRLAGPNLVVKQQAASGPHRQGLRGHQGEGPNAGGKQSRGQHAHPQGHRIEDLS